MPPPPPMARQAMYNNISPPDSNGTDEGQAESSGNARKTTVKPQKACVQCRRSKVKCVHEGGPPCRRCSDTNQECKFRLRADDETWREKTDETLSKLTSAIDTLISRGLPAQSPGALSVSTTPSHTANVHAHAVSNSSHHLSRPAMPMRNSSAPGLYAGYPHINHSPGPGQQQQYPSFPSSSSSFNPHMHAGPSTNRSLSNGGLHPLLSPHSDSMSDLHSPAFDANPTSSTAGTSSPERRLLPRKREAPTPEASDLQAPSPHTPSQHNRPRMNSASLMPPPLPPPAQSFHDQITASPVLSHLLNNITPLYVHGVGVGPRWMMGQTTSYAKATMTIGRDDPRMTSISLGTVSMEKARTLMLFFAEKMQPHSFGFPTYPAAEQMTPVIISAILMAASLYEPWSRNCYSALKSECLAHIKPDQDVHADMPLDPELGIGVEEITGACIASAWIGGELGWRIARVSRWWTIGYLKHFELQDRDVTLGECLTILPPFRQIDMIDKLRIFLAAYVAEAQQAFVLDRPSLVPNSNPMPYVDALRNAFNNGNSNGQHSGLPVSGTNGSSSDTRGSMTGGSQGAKKHPPPPDRQLTGHASILSILLEAQRSQREARWFVNEELGRQHISQHVDRTIADAASVNECVDRLISLWMMWTDDTERWRSEVAGLEDLSSSTASALDLTMTYHLAKAHLGSLALEPEFRANAAVARAAVNEPRFVHMQSHVINMAKANAMSALRLATSSDAFRDRLLYLPGFYHFMLGHSAGFLLLLLQRKSRFMLAGEAKVVLEIVEKFVQIFVTELSTHNFHVHSAHSVHPSMATAEALARACQHVRAQVRGA